MSNRKIVNSVKNLSHLYTIIVGLALSSAILKFIDFVTINGLDSKINSPFLLLLSFIFTLCPFYHGALRHLDDDYIEAVTPNISKASFLFDFTLLFIHGILFVALSALLFKPGIFILILLSIFFIDVIWGIYVCRTKNLKATECIWAIINFVTILIFVFTFLNMNICISDILNNSYPDKMSVTIVTICTLRTFVDYLTGIKFYLPID